ncbi:hypothetical protein BDD12DRAFT_980190 [Trichophaea hybrida]|nr:hypothetical protein BDD12DRAFT_980190 [Trichophaea hybrida]
MFQQAPSRRQASITRAKNRAADITSLFSSLQNSVPAGILSLSTRRMRTNMRGYSTSTSSSATSSAASTPGGNGETSTESTQSSAGQIYTNWVFVTSAEVLARAREGEDDDGDGGGGGEGYHDHTEGGGGEVMVMVMVMEEGGEVMVMVMVMEEVLLEKFLQEQQQEDGGQNDSIATNARS